MTTSGPSTAADLRSNRLFAPAFSGLLVTQFLGAFNDNMFRWLAVPIAKRALGPGHEPLALSLGLACFTIPYLLLAAQAGYLADRFSKRTVIVACKAAEIAIMGLGLAAFLSGNMLFLFSVVALMGAQSALFSPSKMGAIPELVTPARLSQANGCMALVTVVASALGFVAGNWLFGLTVDTQAAGLQIVNLAPAAGALLGVAAAGFLASLIIHRLPAADDSRRFPLNPLGETWKGLGWLVSDKALFRAALGSAFFWFLASLAQINIDTYGTTILHLAQAQIGPLLGILVIGLGVGSVVAGLWSGGKVELGIVPLGAAIICISAIGLYATGAAIDPHILQEAHDAYGGSAFWLLVLGFGAGLFNVPLDAYLQHRSDPRRLGTILAAANFLAFTLMLGSSFLFWMLRETWSLSAYQIFLFIGLLTVPVLIYAAWLLPDATLRCLVWLLTRTIYRVRTFGRENLPERGGALLVANHVSWVDGLLLLTTSSRPIRMIAYADYVNGGIVGKLARLFGVIPIKPSEGPKSIMRSLKTAQEALKNGELVCIFAEGEITRTGQLLPFQRGLMKVLQGTDAPVIPVYLDGLWGSIFSYSGGKFFWKWPRRWPYPVAIHFGRELHHPEDVHTVRRAVQNLGVDSMQQRKPQTLIPPRAFLRRCRARGGRTKVADSSGMSLSGNKLLVASLIFRRVLRRVLGPDEQKVGILLPPSVGGVLANTALAIDGRVTVNLNYTMSDETNNYCVGQAGLRRIITSRRFLEKKPTVLDAEFIFLEDLKEQATGLDKAIAAIQAFATPMPLLERILGLTRKSPDDLFSIIFTSGSTGEPKGVMLSYNNIQSNVEAVDAVFHLHSDDVLLGVLPFFHSFGFTGTLWLVLGLDPMAVYHFNPLDVRMVGELCEKHGVTISMATPTFLRSYLKRCTKEQFHKLDTVIVGAEKLPQDLAQAFDEKFGVFPSEGYGTTELSPVASVNVPPHRAGSSTQISAKPGTVGHPLPGVSAKVTDPDTGEELGVNQEGLIWISGPNVMQGYLNHPEKTAEVIHDGWYNTGDIGLIDDDGFVRITGRLSRFSKIGGEMVPHVLIENAIQKLLDDENEDGSPQVAVTAVPDAKKGERIVVLHRRFTRPLPDILNELGRCGLPNIWIPSSESFVEVEQIPLLGTGKLDLRAVKEVALERFTRQPAEASGDA